MVGKKVQQERTLLNKRAERNTRGVNLLEYQGSRLLLHNTNANLHQGLGRTVSSAPMSRMGVTELAHVPSSGVNPDLTDPPTVRRGGEGQFSRLSTGADHERMTFSKTGPSKKYVEFCEWFLCCSKYRCKGVFLTPGFT